MEEDIFNGFEHPHVMVAMPAFNEEKSVGRVVSYAKKYAHLVLVVNDCSTDNTANVAKEAGAEVISHTTNQGYGGSALTAFQTAQKYQPDVLILMDADGQHNPEDIPRFVAKIQEGYDVVIGSRYLEQDSQEMIPFYRKVGMRALDTSTRLSAKTLETTDVLCGFRAFNKNAYSKIYHLNPKYHGCTDIIVQLSEHGMNFGEISVKVRYDMGNTSKKNPVALGLDLLTGILQMVSLKRPLLFFGLPGVVITILGVALSILALTVFFGSGIWATTLTLVSLMVVMLGLLLCSVSVILFAIAGVLKELK